LGVARDTTKAVPGAPKGSDQVDLGSVISWVKKVKVTDTVALAQLVQIDATCVACTS